jgi:very-short-patch-repair endonuclease
MSKRKEPADYQAMAATRSAVWLGPAVPNANTLTWWKCLVCGRRWRTTHNVLKQGSGCPGCGVGRRSALNRRRPEEYHALAAQHGLRWTGSYPESANHRTEWECPRGHRWMTTYVRIKEGRGCARCARAAHLERCAAERHDEAAYRAAGDAAGMDWLGPKVASANAKTGWRCRACGRTWTESYHKLASGRGCPRCRLDRRNERLRIPAERYRALARGRGFVWLGPRPARIVRPTRWRCPKGHEWETSYASVALGSGCHVCQDRVNGMPVSGVQRRLAKRLGGELNHRVGRRCIDVAIQREGVWIAVEYDSWFYHGHPDQQTHDDLRDRALIRLGWRVLRIRGAYTLPSADELDAAIGWLLAGAERVVITTSEWGEGPCRGLAFDPARKPRPYCRRHGGPRA